VAEISLLLEIFSPLKGQHPFGMLGFEQFEFATTETTADPSTTLLRSSGRDDKGSAA
jgi:hypothetical protein